MKSIFLKFFQTGKKNIPDSSSEIEVPTTPKPNDRSYTEVITQEPNSNCKTDLPQLVAACAQSVGNVRDHNEDTLYCMTSILATHKKNIPFGLYIVADGMGGHQQGEVASKTAVQSVASEVIQKLLSNALDIEDSLTENELQEILETSVLEAHQRINEAAPGSGTTLTAALFVEDQLVFAHVGDSRLYHIDPDKEAIILTRDHSLVHRMIELGHLTEEQAAIHPQRNVLYRALGQVEPVIPDVGSIPQPVSGYLLLCSDGLWGLVQRAEMARIISSNPDLETAAQKLVDAANDAGGTDNISVVLVKLPILREQLETQQ